MRLSEIQTILHAEVLWGEEHLDREVFSACGSDFMSDVLAFVKNQALLLTGLVNPQVVRTADMVEMKCIVFVRGKVPGPDILALAAGAGYCGDDLPQAHVRGLRPVIFQWIAREL